MRFMDFGNVLAWILFCPLIYAALLIAKFLAVGIFTVLLPQIMADPKLLAVVVLTSLVVLACCAVLAPFAAEQ